MTLCMGRIAAEEALARESGHLSPRDLKRLMLAAGKSKQEAEDAWEKRAHDLMSQDKPAEL
jgi:hypothetical protein